MSEFFAHAGHDHQETAAEATAATAPLLNEVGILLAIALVIATFWLIAGYICKAKLPVRVTATLVILLIAGMTCYSIAPIVSTICLAVGFGLAMAAVFIPLMAGRR